MKRIYLSGPITGRDETDYIAHFENVGETIFKKAQGANIEISICSPILFCTEVPADAPWHLYMRACIKRLVDADGIALLQGWEQSRGAKLELSIAQSLKIPVVYLEGPIGPENWYPIFDENREIWRYYEKKAEALLAVFDEVAVEDMAAIETMNRFLDPAGFEYIN